MRCWTSSVVIHRESRVSMASAISLALRFMNARMMPKHARRTVQEMPFRILSRRVFRSQRNSFRRLHLYVINDFFSASITRVSERKTNTFSTVRPWSERNETKRNETKRLKYIQRTGNRATTVCAVFCEARRGTTMSRSPNFGRNER